MLLLTRIRYATSAMMYGLTAIELYNASYSTSLRWNGVWRSSPAMIPQVFWWGPKAIWISESRKWTGSVILSIFMWIRSLSSSDQS